MTTTALPAADPRKAELVLSQLSSLPTLAPIAVRLLELTGREEAHLSEVVQLVESDAALSTRLLSMLQRAEHGVPAAHINVNRAVALLGIPTVRQVVLTTKVLEVFGDHDTGRESAFDRRAFWKHCLAVACTARRLAPAMPQPVDPGDAFLAGLLHDLGKIAFDACLPKSYDRVVREIRRRRDDLLAIERLIIGTDHTVAGRRVAERWKLPADWIECIWLHHLPPDALPTGLKAGSLVRLVWLADALVRTHRLGYSGNDAVIPILSDAAAQTGVDPKACRQALEALASEVEERAGWVGLDDVTSGRMYVDALAESAQHLSRLNDENAAQYRKLSRTADYFAALGLLSESLSPRADLADVCGTGARAVRRAFGVTAASVYVRDGESGGVLLAAVHDADAPPAVRHIERAQSEIHEDEHIAADMSDAGTWLSPAPGGTDAIVDACRPVFGEEKCWLFPIVHDDQWIGGALFTAPLSVVRGLRTEQRELAVLSAAIGLKLLHAIQYARATRQSEDLAFAHQRLAAAQMQLAEAASLRMTAEMAAGAAHELNTPLAVISGRAQLLRGGAADEASREKLDEIVVHAHRASDIISSLMEFAEPPRPVMQRVELRGAIAGAIEDARAGSPAQREFVVSVEPHSAAWCDPQHLRHAVTEVLRNAIEATPENARVEIKARPDVSDETVGLEVVDAGRGMSAEVRERAFDPFFSHRPAGRGRGMGLAHARRWIEANRGVITLESEAGGGTTIRITLPSAAANTDR